MTLDTSPRTYRFLPADILTSGYRVVGKIMIASHGAMGMLNDSTHSAMEINDARMARLHMPTKLVDHFELVRMMKRQVHAVCMARREDLGPQALVRGGYTNVVEYPVRIATSMFEVEGTMELPGRFDFTSIMTDGSRNFLPVFNATLTAILIPALRVESAGILVNRNLVDLMALLNQRVKPEN
ncbi:MAG: hypothetical protein IPN96_10030 [Anaerolineales bacterium]|mgnify:CR=1 FL=1|jgi:hypothetical protein|uniref:hypothetical protein n=1 Tax=Candidatus Villigracilis proximus TaxID=3140683 RepID=UPI00313608FE|nr:hypothetical protein [Anaerolineales bacterium]MBK8617426.1 hypothetical protein [Anaerolineales bacterium]MBK9210352.1 hypothetical protein [Anaerolineales bacterium]